MLSDEQYNFIRNNDLTLKSSNLFKLNVLYLIKKTEDKSLDKPTRIQALYELIDASYNVELRRTIIENLQIEIFKELFSLNDFTERYSPVIFLELIKHYLEKKEFDHLINNYHKIFIEKLKTKESQPFPLSFMTNGKMSIWIYFNKKQISEIFEEMFIFIKKSNNSPAFSFWLFLENFLTTPIDTTFLPEDKYIYSEFKEKIIEYFNNHLFEHYNSVPKFNEPTINEIDGFFKFIELLTYEDNKKLSKLKIAMIEKAIIFCQDLSKSTGAYQNSSYFSTLFEKSKKTDSLLEWKKALLKGHLNGVKISLSFETAVLNHFFSIVSLNELETLNIEAVFNLDSHYKLTNTQIDSKKLTEFDYFKLKLFLNKTHEEQLVTLIDFIFKNKEQILNEVGEIKKEGWDLLEMNFVI